MQLGIYSLHLIFLLLISLQLSTPKITLFTNTYPPFSDCSSNSSHVIGAEIELLRLGFSYLNWTEGVDFEFNCTGETSMAVNSSILDSQYQALVGGITITSDRLKQQTTFSQPTVSSPLAIIYQKENKGWFFIRSFQTSGWLITLATVLLIGGILYLFENRKIALINMIYCACCEFFMVPDYPIEHASGKVLQFFSSFLVLVLVAVFTATSANIFQIERDLAGTLDLSDLKYQQVYTNSVFSDYLKQYGIVPIIIDDQDSVKFAHETDKFETNYFVLDGPYGNYVADQNSELYVAENQMHTMHYSIMYDELFPEALKSQINRAILIAKNQQSFNMFVGEYYSAINNFAPCKNKHKIREEFITLYELRGLWYLLLSGIVIGTSIMVLQQLRIFVNKNYGVYSLQGIRAKIDRKVQRRMATLFAIHTGISIQCITFLKKLNQEVLQSICQVAMKAVDLKALRDKENPENNPKQESLPNSNAELLFDVKGGFGSRAAAAISWIRGGSRKKSNIETLQISPNKKGSNDSSPRTPGSVVRSKRSSMLKQTMYTFKLNSELMQKVQNLALSSERSALNSPETDDKPPSSSRSGHISLQVELNKSSGGSFEKDNSTVTEKNVSVVNKLIGKKGIKQNKQMTEAAKALLEKKESALLEEFQRREKDISVHLKSLNRSRRPRPLTIEPFTPKSRNATLYPSVFKLKMLGDQSPLQNKSRKKLRNLSSPESSLLKSVISKPYEAAVAAASGSDDQRPDQSESKFKILLNLQEISEFSSLESGEKRPPEDNSIEFFEESPKFRLRAAVVKSGQESPEAESPNEYRGDETPIHHLSLSPYLFSNKYEASN